MGQGRDPGTAADASPFGRSHDGGVFEYEGRLDHDSFDRLLLWSSRAKASDVTVQSGQPVWAEIGGRWSRVTRRPVSHPEAEMIVRAIYGDNGPGEVNSGHDLDPSYEVRNPDGIGRMRYRVNVTGGRMVGGTGFQLTIRTLPTQPIEIGLLGIEPGILANLRPAQGLNLITGPTGSGKSTLLASAVRFVCERPEANEKIVEYSKPIEYVYDGLDFPTSFVFQTDVGRHLRPRSGGGEDSEWAYAIRNALRRKPSIILLGEARDRATIQGCVEAALTGHLVMSTMHTIGVPETVRRAVMPFPGGERRGIAVDLLECLNLVVTQLLLPRRGGGKVGCREYMLFDRRVRDALVDADVDDWPRRIRELLRERRVVGASMADSARALLDRGEIAEETWRYVAARTAGDGE